MTAPVYDHIGREPEMPLPQCLDSAWTRDAEDWVYVPDIGQLWERLAWRDFVENGAPSPRQGRRSDRYDQDASPEWVRGYLFSEVERRRPAMRERRENKPCKACEGRGWDYEVMLRSDDQDEMVICPDCWGSGLYVGSISEHADNGGTL